MSAKNRWILLAGLASLLIVVGYVMVLLLPSQARIGDVREEIVAAEDRTSTQRAELASLELVRENEPQILAEIAAFDAFLPQERSVGRMFDQMKDAADRAFLTIDAFSLGRPSPVPVEEANLPTLPDGKVLVAYDMQMSVSGDFYEVLEFVRQLENNRVVPQAFTLTSVQLSSATGPAVVGTSLQASMFGRAFAVVPSGVMDEPAPETPPSPDGEENVDGEMPDGEMPDGEDIGEEVS